MRKLISLALVCVLLLGWCAMPAAAGTADIALLDTYQEKMLNFYRHFMDQPGGWEALSHDSFYGYNHAAEELDSNRFFQTLLDATHFLTDASLVDVLGGTYDVDDIKVQYYVTALSSLLVTMEENLADVRATQAKATSSMSLMEYMLKTGSAVAGVFSEVAHNNTFFHTVFTMSGIGLDTVEGSLNTLERYEALTLNAETYLSYRTLLQTLKDHSTDPLLARAAGHLMDAVDCNFRYRMEHFQDFADTAVTSLSGLFFITLDQVIESLSPKELASDTWRALSTLAKASNMIENFKLGVAIGELAMDVLIGSSGLIQRYYEMAAMASARDTLISVIMKKDADIADVNDISEISEITELLTDLNYVNLRGAYCVYQINRTDGHLLSLMLGSKDASTWFDTVQRVCIQMAGSISRIVPDLGLDSNDLSTTGMGTQEGDGFEYNKILPQQFSNLHTYDKSPDAKTTGWTAGTGFLNSLVYDLDQDGMEELLVIFIQKAAALSASGNKTSVYPELVVYENIDGAVTEADRISLGTLQLAGSYQPSINYNSHLEYLTPIFLYTASGKPYICLEMFDAGVFGNGTEYGYFFYEYDGEGLDLSRYIYKAPGSGGIELYYAIRNGNTFQEKLAYSSWPDAKNAEYSGDEPLQWAMNKLGFTDEPETDSDTDTLTWKNSANNILLSQIRITASRGNGSESTFTYSIS